MSSDLEKRIGALEAWRNSVEPHISRMVPLGPNPRHEQEMAEERQKVFQRLMDGVKLKDAPPVDRSAQVLVGGKPVPEDCSHTNLKANGQQKNYIVLTAEERAKGFVRPVRTAYLHVGKDPVMEGVALIRAGEGGCGTRTTMNRAIAETYARDPKFYSGTFCCGCGVHRSLDEFIWEGTNEGVGT